MQRHFQVASCPAQQAIFAVVIEWCSNAEGYLKLARLLVREQHRLQAVRPSAAGNNLPKKRGYRSFIPYPQKLWKTLWKTLLEA
ncbi:hypothetical protein A7Q01_03525 [Eikenella sp. NML96-A-049]|nr:hypothetical protein A7P97_01260 [Eikenella sp. NML070372]OAM40675.1 hypothetical protein A7Q01_03525 [Eikenella sp. NML96-A-049]